MTARLEQKKIRGLKTAWWRSGSPDPHAPIAILFHGFPDSPSTWEGQLEVLENNFLVLRPFLRGAGESEPTEQLARYQRHSLLLDYLEILSEADPDKRRPVVIFGHDLGGVSAWELALALGDRAKAVVLVAGMGLDGFWERRYRLSQHMKSWYMYLMQVPGLAETAFEWFGPQIVSAAYKRSGLEFDCARWEELGPTVLGMLGHYRAGAREVVRSARAVHRLKCPLLVIWGAKDPYLSLSTQQEWERMAAAVEIRVLDAGHWPHQEKRDVANRFIEKFLQPFAQAPSR